MATTDPVPARRRRSSRLASPLLLATLLTAGCDKDLPPDTTRQPLAIAELPENVRAAARKALPGVTLQDSWKNLEGKARSLHSYEVRGRAANGKIREVRVAADGKVLEVE